MSSTPKLDRTRESTWTARSEWPPRAKKSSSAPTEERLRISHQMEAMPFSSGVPGALPLPAPSGSGSAARSTLPCAVRGARGEDDDQRGEHGVGRRPAAKRRSSSGTGAAPAAGVT